MASIKTVLMEMLSTFDAKSRMSAKQLREQLHQGWPVSNSSVAIEQLGKELRDEMRQSLEVVRIHQVPFLLSLFPVSLLSLVTSPFSLHPASSSLPLHPFSPFQSLVPYCSPPLPLISPPSCLTFLCVVLFQVRASAALELEQVVNEVRRQVEKEKDIAIAETKKMKWVRIHLTSQP